MKNERENLVMLPILLIVLGVLSRVFMHFWNFTPILAIALFAGFYLSRRNAFIVPLITMIISDVILGFHDTIFFTWGTILLISWIGLRLRENKSVKTVAFASVGSAIIFFIITNFAVWLVSGMYPKNWAGLTECYIAAIPYFRGTLLSTIIYTAVLFGGYEFLAARLKHTRLAKAL
ncbi:MAG: hypothetical protein KBD53_02540 [Candidatus Omnitrophica bacterium]|nr:hypothetical protein [Candidatus Omnitrophota bacterium]